MGRATQGEKAQIVQELQNKGYALKHLLIAFKLPKSTYYFELNKADSVAARNRELAQEIKEIFARHKGRYGVRRVTMELRNRGRIVNHKRVQRIMHQLSLKGNRPKEKYRSYTGDVGKVAPNLIARNFHAAAPLEKWTTDVSQFTFSWGKCYLSCILDMYTNEVVAYDLSLSPNLAQVKRMLTSAFAKFPSLHNLIFHSDQGWQYQHAGYRRELVERNILQSMSRKGNCYDNGIMESFFGRLKNEMYYGHEKEFASFASFSAAMDEYIYYYNYERIQTKTKWMPPVKYRIASMG